MVVSPFMRNYSPHKRSSLKEAIEATIIASEENNSHPQVKDQLYNNTNNIDVLDI